MLEGDWTDWIAADAAALDGVDVKIGPMGR